MTTTSLLPKPSKTHATCAWCGIELRTIVDLLGHVDDAHLKLGPAPSRSSPALAA
jgi:hypothetical protein